MKRIDELNYTALTTALKEYKESSYYNYYKSNTSIIESILDDMIAFDEDGHIIGEYRYCTNCGKMMMSGYLIDDIDYYCSDECLYNNMSHDVYMELYEEDRAYYTEWY